MQLTQAAIGGAGSTLAKEPLGCMPHDLMTKHPRSALLTNTMTLNIQIS